MKTIKQTIKKLKYSKGGKALDLLKKAGEALMSPRAKSVDMTDFLQPKHRLRQFKEQFGDDHPNKQFLNIIAPAAIASAGMYAAAPYVLYPEGYDHDLKYPAFSYREENKDIGPFHKNMLNKSREKEFSKLRHLYEDDLKQFRYDYPFENKDLLNYLKYLEENPSERFTKEGDSTLHAKYQQLLREIDNDLYDSN